MMKKLIGLAVLMISASALFAGSQKELSELPWEPAKPITIIVPWGPGGSADQATRVLAGVIEEPVGQKVIVVNRPGAAGLLGTKNALDAIHDGYTWAAGAAVDLGGYKILGLLDTTWDEWELFLSVADVSVIAVNADSAYKTFDDLLEAFYANPGEIAVATAGLHSAGHNAIESIAKYTGVEYKHVTYDSGDSAVIAAVAGETEVVAQLAAEEAEMLRDGKLRALAVLSDKPLELADYGEIPPVTNWIDEFIPTPIYLGIWIPSDAPVEVLEAFVIIWEKYVAGAEALDDYAMAQGTVFDPVWGVEAKERAMPYLQQIAWNYYDVGKAQISPDSIGIPKP